MGRLAAELDARRALVVSDPGIVEVGHSQRGIDSLKGEGIECALFDGVIENPTTAEVDRGVAVANEFQPDLLVGLGGGSSIDCAKGINFITTNGGSMQDYWGEGKATQPMLPMIAVPTTAGTGSETQSFALISDSKTHVKMACGDDKAACRIALLDPKLTLTQPADVTAITGMDAIAHALETYVTTRRTPMSILFSREAWRLLAGNYARVLDEPDDLDARGAMQLGSCLAGLAIGHSMLGATHALSNPLTACYGITHGRAIALMLPHVIHYNGKEVDSWYADLVREMPGGLSTSLPAATALAEFVTSLVEKAGLATCLKDCGVEQERLPELAASAAEQWTGTFNPRPVSPGKLLALYQAAF